MINTKPTSPTFSMAFYSIAVILAQFDASFTRNDQMVVLANQLVLNLDILSDFLLFILQYNSLCSLNEFHKSQYE